MKPIAIMHRRNHGAVLAWALAWAMIPCNLFGFLVVDNREGFMGSTGSITLPSLLVLCFLIFTCSIGSLLYLMRFKATALWSVLSGEFVAICYAFSALMDDWLAALLLIGINAVVLIYLPDRLRARYCEDTRYHAWEIWLSALAVGLIVLWHGYSLTDNPWAILACALLLVPLVSASVASDIHDRWRQGWHGPWAEWVLFLALPVLITDPARVLTLFGIRQSVRIVRLLYQDRNSQFLIEKLYDSPAQLLTTTFSFIIIMGSVLLALPVSSAGGKKIEAIDALFTATSATCVTGLIVLDTPNDFSEFGQIVILALIQVGGLGFMSISTFAALVIGKKLGLAQEWAMASLIEEKNPRELYRMIKFIILATFAVELSGALLLFTGYLHENYPVGQALWCSLFHSVSAFCNAGFALHSDNMMPFVANPLILLTVSVLIISGGIGFAVLAAVWNRWISRPGTRGLNLHSKLALFGTALLLAGGTLLFLYLESSHILQTMTPGQKLVNAFFQSTTSRTAGFNSVAFDRLQPATIYLFLVLMFIGACPGSTGGGIKVTTAAVLCLNIRAILTGRRWVEIMGKSIPEAIVLKATAIATLSLVVIGIAFWVLLVTQHLPFVELIFESVSAFGTVGLSMGITPKLNDFGKIVIITLMFVGRVGPLTLALLLETKEDVIYRLPDEDVSVG